MTQSLIISVQQLEAWKNHTNMMQLGMYILMGFNIAAVIFFIIWGVIFLCKKKEKNHEISRIGSQPRNPKPLISILKPCSEVSDSDENDDEPDPYDVKDFSELKKYEPGTKYERRAHFAAEPFLVSK